jgi:hypothetical protein
MKILKEILVLGSRPPDYVFSQEYIVVAFLEFDVGLTRKYWNFVLQLARAAGDEHVFVVSLEPDAEHYFFREFGRYGAISLPTDAPGETYVASLGEHPEASSADSLRYNSEYLVWTSNSGKWIAFGARGFSFIAIAFKRGFSPNLAMITQSAGVKLFRSQSVLADLILPAFLDSTRAAEFSDEFRRNYLMGAYE